MTPDPEPEQRAGLAHRSILTLEALVVLITCYVGLRLFGYRIACARLGRLAIPLRLGARPSPPQEIQAAVSRAARVIPSGSSCLIRSLATSLMCARRGRQLPIRFGVRPHNAGFAMHAWVEFGGGREPDRWLPNDTFRASLSASTDRIQDSGTHLPQTVEPVRDRQTIESDVGVDQPSQRP
jgi:hypothetical protein